MKSHLNKIQYQNILLFICFCCILSCRNQPFEYDATGTFEATEVIVSAEASGKINTLNVQEGDLLLLDQQVGFIDTVPLYLRKLQLIQTLELNKTKIPNVAVQIAALNEQITKANFEKNRITQLVQANAANTKQLDDIESQITILQKQLAAQMNLLHINTSSLDAEAKVIDVQIAQINDQLEKCKIINPIAGRVLSKYCQEKELTLVGKPLYKIADTENLFLRAYLISDQLNKIHLGKTVSIVIHNQPQKYSGTVSWISSQAEFTPKSIQTKDERQNLVYAIKVSVKNTDGALKIGMYADLILQEP